MQKHFLFILVLTIAAASAAHAAPEPPVPAREFRAAWITPVLGFDWPAPTRSATEQKAELIRLFDKAKALGLNAVILHVRISGDALYASQQQPWSAHLTGTQGKSPGYDPLAFAIKEAHARGLQLHAWFNPFRATPTPRGTRVARTHVTRTHPGWIVKYGSETWINPGIPAARKAVLAAIMEVVGKYDIDGVHLDDYFYPYLQDGVGSFNDPISFRKYGKAAGFTSRADWRRNNINVFVQSLYSAVHDAKPWLPVGISPFGIWKSGVPAGVTGLDAYSEIFADSRKWLAKGWVDYLAPQLYWPLDGNQQRFSKLLDWWQTQNPNGRHIWPGLAAFLAHRPSWGSQELNRQIDVIRDVEPNDPGHIHFHLSSTFAHEPLYDDVAITPPMPWLAKAPPAAPVIVRQRIVGDSVEVTLGPMKPQVRWLVVQTKQAGSWQTEVRFRKSTTLRVPKADQVVLTPLSRTGALGTRVDLSAAASQRSAMQD